MEESQTSTPIQTPTPALDKYANHDADLVPVSRYLGIEHLSEVSGSDQGKIERILSVIREKSSDRVDILIELQNIERQLDPPPIGVSRLERLYQWMALEIEEQRILKAKKAMLKPSA